MLNYKEFLNENKKIKSDPTLKGDFNYINNLLFNNQVKEVPINYFNSKTKAGLMRVRKGEASIQISNFFELTEAQRKSIVAHEMIHLIMYQNDIPDNNDHGKTFMKIVKELNDKQDEFVISKTEMLSDLKSASKTKKNMGSIVFIINDNDYGATFINNEIINDKKTLNEFCDQLKKYIKTPNNVFKKDKSVKLEFYKIDDPYFTKFRIKRTLNLTSLEVNAISENEYKTIQLGNKIMDCKIK